MSSALPLWAARRVSPATLSPSVSSPEAAGKQNRGRKPAWPLANSKLRPLAALNDFGVIDRSHFGSIGFGVLEPTHPIHRSVQLHCSQGPFAAPFSPTRPSIRAAAVRAAAVPGSFTRISRSKPRAPRGLSIPSSVRAILSRAGEHPPAPLTSRHRPGDARLIVGREGDWRAAQGAIDATSTGPSQRPGRPETRERDHDELSDSYSL